MKFSHNYEGLDLGKTDKNIFGKVDKKNKRKIFERLKHLKTMGG